MEGVEFVRLGGKMRPVAFNMNVIKDVEKEFVDERPQLRQRFVSNAQRMLEESGKRSLDELTEDEMVAAYQDSHSVTEYTIFQIYAALKEGARKTNQDFRVPDITVEWDEEKEEPVEHVNGTRPATPEDVSEWLEKADGSDALDTIAELMTNNKYQSNQAEALERHMARMGGEKKRSTTT